MTSSISSIIERATRGDQAAESEILDMILPSIKKAVGTVLKRCGRIEARDYRQEMEDIAQDVLLSLFEDKGKKLLLWDPSRGLSLPKYVELISRNMTVSILRSRRKNPWGARPVEPIDLESLAGSTDNLEDAIERSQLRVAIHTAVSAELTTKGRTVLQGILNNIPDEDIAKSNQMTTNAVHVWRSRIIKIAKKVARSLSISVRDRRDYTAH